MLIQNLKKIKNSVEKMSIDNLKYIYNIINKNNQSITKKSDCFLINLGDLNNNTIIELLKFIEFIENNQILLQEQEMKKQQYAQEMKNDESINNDVININKNKINNIDN